MMWWPLIFISYLFAQDRVVEKYCFSSEGRRDEVASKSRFILVPSDKIEKDGQCFAVQMNSHRRELVQRYILNVAPEAQIDFSSAELKRSPCNLKVEKIKTTTGEQRDISAGQTTTAQDQTSQKQSTETFEITTLKEFEFTVDQDSIKGKCRYITPERYEISLQVEKKARPLTPPVQPGTVVIINDQTPPPIQETSFLKTEIQLTKGQKIDIGGVVKNLKNQNRSIDISPEVSSSSSGQNTQEQVFLSLN